MAVLPENVVRPNVTRRDARTRDAARPGSADPRLGPRSGAVTVAAGRPEPVRTSFRPELAELAARGVDGEGGMRGLVGVDGDQDHEALPVVAELRWGGRWTGRLREHPHASVESHRGRTVAGDTPPQSQSPKKSRRISLTSSAAPSVWGRTFTDARLAAAVVDRLTFRAHIIQTGTESYRLRVTTAAKGGAPTRGRAKPDRCSSVLR